MGEEEARFVKPQVERRQYRRAQIVTQVRCESVGREELLVTRDVSVGGLFLHALKPFPSGAEVSLTFSLAAGAPAISCRGKVVNSIPARGMGIEFDELEEAARHALEIFVDEAR